MPITPPKFIDAIKKCLPILKTLPDDLEDILIRMLSTDGGSIDRERFNIILSTWKLEPVNRHFFSYYFGTRLDTVKDFAAGMHRFIKDALWHFGDVRRGFAVLSKVDDIGAYIKKHQFDLEEFKSRMPWTLVADIPPLDRGFLGYVSGQRPYSEKEVLSITERILKLLEDNQNDWRGLNAEELKERLTAQITPQEMERARQLLEIDESQRGQSFGL